MRANKNNAPKRELGICPKFTTKNLHTSLSRSRCNNGPTNPRNKPQMIPKRKRNSRSKGLSSTAKPHANCPRPPGGPSARYGGLSEKRSRASSTAPSITGHLRWARGPSAPPRTVRHSSTDLPRTSCNENPSTKWIERKTCKNSRRTRRTLGLPHPRGLSAMPARTVRQEKIL
jgi:hypothetical protein